MPTLSKSDFKLGNDCPAKLSWRELRYPTVLDDNPYLALLAEGGYMVEQLARLGFSTGVELPWDPSRPAEAWDASRQALTGGDGTWFEATLHNGRLLARVDILRRKGNHFDLFEVKSKSFDGDDLGEGPSGPFRTTRKPHGIRTTWLPYLEDVAFQVHVFRRCFPESTITPHLIVVDKSRTTTVDGLPAMFDIRRGNGGGVRDLEVRFIGDPATVKPEELLRSVRVTDEVDELLTTLGPEIDAMEARYGDDGVAHVPGPLGMHCRSCEFRVADDVVPNGFRECWGALASVEPSVLDLYQFGHTKVDGVKLGDLMIQNGRIGLDEVEPERLVKKDGQPTAHSPRQLIQINHTIKNQSWYGPGLAAALGNVQYPLHFIDFETSGLALPYHAGMRPYQSIGFQWSCHTLARRGADPVHCEWLNMVDLWPSLEFAETLREAIGDTGTVLIWSKYERTILRQTMEQLMARGGGSPGLIEWLEPLADKGNPHSRLLDQNDLCLKHYFHPRMAGRTSIKRVLDATWQDDATLRERFAAWMGSDAYVVPPGQGPYEGLPTLEIDGVELDVADGTGAMRAYQAMLYGAERHDPAIKAAWVELLRRYCKLDTLAMVLIWDHWVRNIGSTRG